MLILVTGGAGYIGMHAVRTLLQAGYRVVVLDNLLYGHRDCVEKQGVPLVEGQVGDRALLDQLLSGEHPACDGEPVQAVMHFAAFAYVGESVAKPDLYYRNNLGDSLVLVEALLAEGDRRGTSPPPIVFSSTCATYGHVLPEQIPITEDCPQNPINPYGRSKWMVEQVLLDCWKAHGLSHIIFRYFNAAGADPAGDLGEDHTPETHLIPLAFDVVLGRLPCLTIHGDDYSTSDGTCVRDYIHVLDLAEAHLLGLQQLLNGRRGSHVYNLGNGVGYSVQQVIDTTRAITKRVLSCHAGPRRPGDPPILVASSEKARTELGWQPHYPQLETMISHAWHWHRKRLV